MLETERRLGERLRAARAESEALVIAAQEEAARQEAALAAEVREGTEHLDERLAAERRRRIAELAEAAEREAQAYESVPAGRLAAVARGLAERFLVGEDAA